MRPEERKVRTEETREIKERWEDRNKGNEEGNKWEGKRERLSDGGSEGGRKVERNKEGQINKAVLRGGGGQEVIKDRKEETVKPLKVTR